LSLREFLDELFLCGQRQPVFTCKHLIPQVAEVVMCNRLVAFGAEDQPHGRVLCWVGPMLSGVIQIKVHLASIGVREFTCLEVDKYEAPKAAVKKHQINAVPFIADPEAPMHDPALSSGKRLVLYCASGGRSALAAKTLRDMGIANVCHMAGGFGAWVEAGGPAER